MKTNNLFTLPLMALAATALTSCWDDDEKVIPEPIDPNAGKEMIAFTSNGGEAITRASIDGTRAGFTAPTKIVMRIKAEDLHTSAEDTRYTRTIASAKTQTTADDDHNGENLLASTFRHSDVTISGENVRYWDDAFGRYSKLSVYAVCVPNKSKDGILGNDILTEGSDKVDATNNPNWFTEATENESLIWEVPATNQTTGQAGLSATLNNVTDGTLESKDLCYSNNIRYRATTAEKGVYRSSYDSGTGTWSQYLTNGQMYWYGKDGKDITTSSETAGKFDQGHLIFKHALTKYTINLTEGAGFSNSIETDFAFTNNTENVALLNFPTKGSFDLSTATWTISERNDVKNLPEITDAEHNGKTKTRTLQALSLPGYDLVEDPTANALRFTIDYNEYVVTKEQIQKKIAEWAEANNKTETTAKEFHKFVQGYHYVINITVGKKAIDNITAEIVDWETVETNSITAENAYITMNLEDRGSSSKIEKYTKSKQDNFDIYRAEQKATDIVTSNEGFQDFYAWKTGYTTDGKATPSWIGKKINEEISETDGEWSTGWFWPDNKTAYHFRVAGNDSNKNDNPTVNKDETDGDYYTIAAGSIDGTTTKNSDEVYYNDFIWGAPFADVTDAYKFVYTTTDGFALNGTTKQIYHAIGATKQTINMMLFHMTSQIFVNVTTSLDSDPSHVVLNDVTNDTKVEILRFYDNGKVLMGNGREMVTGDHLEDAQEITHTGYTAGTAEDPAITTFSYGMVPQTLDRFVSGTDGNSYKVGLRITTPDGNQYVIEDLSKNVYATISENHIKNPYTEGTGTNAGKYLVNYWYPGYKYYYNVKIVKTGIVHITAQLVDWETVTGDLGEITLEGTN